jgi:hypothetical protein
MCSSFQNNNSINDQVMKKVTEKKIDEKMVLITSACAKMFVGDVVEKGKATTIPQKHNTISLFQSIL